ncbi:hypothetical protein CNMCM5793_007155 [Aspergillus hiratsukae]|uniref:Cell wall protein n=1 Tax=Aspergillus hiratsukae TaxID=1194566 RepID=A0A8H6UMS9_9EURO|nr:hypothetical protein CNMCM5793_007155 [Aspergillus hiratsukae]KAF7157559.1 hypothetical protein CNMCM6106_003366 [Aspergillus hiratsukae]
MRSNSLFLLASLASYVLALPTDLESRHLKVGADVDIGDLSIGAGISIGHGLDLSGLIGAILGGHTRTSALLAGLSAQAAAALQGGVLGCKAGAIHAAARAELAAWLRAGAAAELDASIKASLLDWCEGDVSVTLDVDVCAGLSVLIPTCADIAAKGDLFVTIDGIFSSAEVAANVVLSASAQASLSAFLSASVGAALDAKVRAGLGLCAGGGVFVDLAADVQAALKVWLASSECSLSASLKIAVLAWLEGKVGADVIAIGSLPSGGLATISAGASIAALVEETGLLSASAQLSLAAFLEADISAGLDVHVLAALEACAKGGAAVSLDVEVRTALVAWLTGSSCSLGAELKAVVLLWLSFAVEADLAVSVSTGLLGELTSFLTGTIEATLGAVFRGVLSIMISGESMSTLSIDARAQLAAILGGAAGIEIDASIEIILIGWLTGCGHLPGGSGFIRNGNPGTSTPAVPVTGVPSLPAVPTPSGIPSGSVPVSIPNGASPTGASSVPIPVVPSGSVPSGASPTEAPSGTVPAVPEASETPCDTLTSETVIPIATYTEAGPVPSGASPTGGAGASVPSGPEASETPCDTFVSQTVIPVATKTEAVSSGAAAITPAPTVVPSKVPKVITITTTVSVAAC